MIMITITKELFEKVVSSATSSTNEVFDMIQPKFEWVDDQLKVELLGDMYAHMDGVPGLNVVVTKLICLRAYYEEIPHLDLVLTPTGFGVVSNQNVVPASADRVQRLSQIVKNAYEDNYDRAIEMLIGTEWADTTQALMNSTNMIFTAKQFRLYTDSADAHRSDMQKAHSAIYVAEEKVREHISAELFDYLLDKMRHDTVTKIDSVLIDMICRFIAFCISKNYTSAKNLLRRIDNYAENNVTTFTAYKESREYQAKHFENYENKKDDACYFFG